MTATANTVITDALQLLRVIAAEETPQAYALQDGLRWLNRKLHGLKGQGADIDYQDIGLADAVPVPVDLEEPVTYMLAATLAPLWGSQLTPEVAVEAQEAMKTLQSYYARVGELRVDESLQERTGRHIYFDGEI